MSLKIPILIDTNFLVTALDFKINFTAAFSESLLFSYELVTIKEVIEELDRLLTKGKREVRIVLNFFEKNVKFIQTVRKTEGNLVDDLILETALAIQGVVATNDRELRSRLKKLGIPRLIIRSKKRFLLEGSLSI